MVKTILFTFLVVIAMIGCNDDDEPPVPKKYNLKILITPDDGGTVSRSIYGPIVEGATIQLQAGPSDNFSFKEWQGDVTGTNSSIFLEINSDKTITAVFDSYDPKELFYLDKNGVTIKCQDWGVSGQSGELNGIVYTIVDKDMLRQMIRAKEDVTKVCTSKITDMTFMFYVAFVFNQDISSWDVSNVSSMEAMFFQAGSFNQDISSWDVSNVTNMQAMFYESSFNQDIATWDVSNVTDMGSMFRDSQFNQNLSSWVVDNVTDCNEFSLDNMKWTLPKPNFKNCDP